MKIRNIIIAAATFFTAVSCAELEDNSNNLQPETKYTIYANVVETKTSMTDGVVTWKNGDAIKVAVRNSETANAALAEFKNTAANGIKTATFEGKLLPSHKNITAIYPASAYNSESASGSLVTIPAEQFGVAGNFPVDAAGSSIFPAFAYCEGENADGQIVMNFKHVGGLFGVEIPEYLENITKVELECAGAALAGDFNLAVADAENASLTSVTPVSKITLQPAAGAKVFAAGKYYVAMAPGKYTGIKITLTTAVGGTFVRTSDTFTYEIKRNGRVRFNLANIIANAKVGDCFLADGTWADASKEAEGQVDGKEVIGYVISTDSSHMNEDNAIGYSLTGELDKRIVKGVRHGYVISKTINKRKWGDTGTQWVSHVIPWDINTDTNPYYVYDSYTDLWHKDPKQNKPYSVNSNKMCGYSNSQYWNKQEISLINTKPAYSPYSTICYVPSLGDMRFLLAAFAAVDCTKLPFSNYVNKEFWTSSISRSYNAWGPSQVYASVTFTFTFAEGKLSEKNNLMAGRQYENNVMYLMAF